MGGGIAMAHGCFLNSLWLLGRGERSGGDTVSEKLQRGYARGGGVGTVIITMLKLQAGREPHAAHELSVVGPPRHCKR